MLLKSGFRNVLNRQITTGNIDNSRVSESVVVRVGNQGRDIREDGMTKLNNVLPTMEVCKCIVPKKSR